MLAARPGVSSAPSRRSTCRASAGVGGSLVQRRVGHDADQRALERADAGGHAARDLGEHLGRHLDAVEPGALGEDRPPHLDLGRVELDDEPRAEALRSGASSRPGMSSGARSEVITSWRPASSSALKVWKNSSRVASRPARNWTSSISTTSALRKRCLKSAVLLPPHGLDELARELLDRGVADPAGPSRTARRSCRWRAGGASCRSRASRGGRAGCRSGRAAPPPPAPPRARSGCPRRSRTARRCTSGSACRAWPLRGRRSRPGRPAPGRAAGASPEGGCQSAPTTSTERVRVEARGRGAAQEWQVALGDRGADVLGRAHVDRAAADRGQLERLEPDVELEVRRLPAELVADVRPRSRRAVRARAVATLLGA